eukprot:scaffold315497_cov15-Tisochrysis_lutea.AAC.1
MCQELKYPCVRGAQKSCSGKATSTHSLSSRSRSNLPVSVRKAAWGCGSGSCRPASLKPCVLLLDSTIG